MLSMPRIDPQQLLKTLGVLLSPHGGIKSSKEVVRLVQLMQKFSRKLVSKCIYIQILKATEARLLDEFLRENGWELLNQWLSDAIRSQNWPLCLEMITLFCQCPITARTLKENAEENQAPKLINQLRQEPTVDASIRSLAASLYGKWVSVVSPRSPAKTSPNQTRLTRGKSPQKLTVSDSGASEDEDDSANDSNLSDVDRTTSDKGPISLLQSLADEVSDNIKKEELNKKEKADKKERKSKSKDSDDSDAKRDSKYSRSHQSGQRRHQHGSRASNSGDKDDSKRKLEGKDVRDRDCKESKRFRPDPRDEVNADEKRRIKEMARRLKEEAQVKKDKETLIKVGGASASGLSKIPKIPKKQSTDGDQKGKSFAEMMGVLDSKPKTVKTPLNKNKTAAMLEGMTVKSSSSKHHNSGSKDRLSSSSHKKEGPRDSGRKELSPTSPSPRKEKDSSSLSGRRHQNGERKLTPLLTSNAKGAGSQRKHSLESDSPKASVKSPNVSESTGFMDAIFGSISKTKEDQQKKLRKRRLSDRDENKVKEDKEDKEDKEQEPIKKIAKESPKSETTSSEEKEAEPAKKQPILPFSFYRDTLENPEEKPDENSTSSSNNGEESSKLTGDHSAEVKKVETKALEEPTDNLPREVKGILVYHRGKEKRNRGIRWKPDAEIAAVRYFELDEDERVNVNKIKFEHAREFESKLERAALKQKGHLDDEPEINAWYTPVAITFEDANKPLLQEQGKESKERDAQADRERKVLQALYFSKEMTPPSPAEPDSNQSAELIIQGPKLIPDEDRDADESSFHDYNPNGWPEPKINQVDQQATFESAFSLNPALSNLLASIETGRLGSLMPPPSTLSKEDQSTLAAQTEALQKLGMLPGVNMPPSFPPPIEKPVVNQSKQPPRGQFPTFTPSQPMIEDAPLANNLPLFDTPPPGPVQANEPNKFNQPPPFQNQTINNFEFGQGGFGNVHRSDAGNSFRGHNHGRGGGFHRNRDQQHHNNRDNFRDRGNNRDVNGHRRDRDHDDHRNSNKIGTRPCKFFSMRGSCRDGDRCRYVHQRN